MFFFLIFPGTVITEEKDQVGPQAPEDPHDSSTDSCLTFPYSSNSPRPFPPSPVHSVTDSPIRVSPLFIAASNNSPVHRSIDHYSPVPTSSTSSYFWPDYQPSLVSSRDSSANDALNLAFMPRVFDHFPTSLPLNPLHYDFFTVLRAASPVVTFHCPSPLTQKSFSSVYSISFPRGHDSKPLLVAGIKQ